MTDNVKFMYLPDPQEPKRVLTLARVINTDTECVDVAWCVNTPKNGRKGGYDSFDKSKARAICRSRLKHGYYISLRYSNPPADYRETMLQGICRYGSERLSMKANSEMLPRIVERIVKQTFEGMDDLDKYIEERWKRREPGFLFEPSSGMVSSEAPPSHGD